MDNSTGFFKKQETIENFSNDKLNMIVSIENTKELNDMLNSEPELIMSMSNFLSSSVKTIHAAAYHDSLNIFEKHGFIKASTKAKFEITNTILGTVSAAAIPLLINSISFIGKKRQENNFKEFFLAWIGYINHSPTTPQMRKQAQKILKSVSINSRNNEIENIINEYADKSSNSLPHLSSKNFISLNKEENDSIYLLAKEIIAPCDLSDNETKKRAMEFLEECFGISNYEARRKLDDIINAQEYHSQLTGFSSICFMTKFSKFAETMKNAYMLGKYNEDMDVFAQKRLRNQAALKEFGQSLIANGAEAIFSGNPSAMLKTLEIPIRYDLLKTSSTLMQDVFNSRADAKLGMDIMSSTYSFAKDIGLKK